VPGARPLVTAGDFATLLPVRQHAGVRDLNQAVVVVVGATGGIGAAICDVLLERGAVVLGASRSGPDIRIDLRDSRAGDAVVRAALGTQGRLDGVVNAAGVAAYGDLADTDDVTIEELFLTNALGPLWLARRVLPALAQSRGFFAIVTGAVAEESRPGLVAYSASKAALSHALPGLRREARRLGVHVADLRPPLTATGIETRAIAGSPESPAVGLDPDVVAARVVAAIEADEAEVASSAFAAG
jgi:cyclic-di-GMP-binding biofilm dispersal mediator protein